MSATAARSDGVTATRCDARTVNVIEPTLEDVSGHSLNVVRSLSTAGQGLRFRLWIGRDAKLSVLRGIADELRPYFRRRLRKLQAYLLYRRLLRTGEPIVVTTAGTLDLYALDWGATGVIPPATVFLYFHQVRRLTDKKRERFRRLAKKQPNLVLMGTTPAITEIFRDCGFPHATTLSLPPGLVNDTFPEEPLPFQRLLYAGAARTDKGFGAIVDLVSHLAATDSTIPITVQTSGDHYGRYDAQVRAHLDRLRTISYAPLTTLPDPLDLGQYAALFPGSISLQPYQRAEYATKMSAITLDSLTAGCPVVTVAGTSMAETVEHFGAGAIVAEPTPEALGQACAEVIAEYPRYRDNARRAGAQIRRENSWGPLIDALRRERP